MSNKISIKQISVGDELYDFDSKYWGGLEPIDKQDTLVSGLNIKTINGESLLGEGDIDTNDTFFELLICSFFTAYVFGFPSQVELRDLC